MSSTPADGSPNVLLLNCHDLGRTLSCYGANVETPAIDRLAAEGAQFENYFAGAPTCSPSRACLTTGNYQHNNGMFGLANNGQCGGWDLNEGQTLLPDLFRQTGYDTYLFNYQHVDRHDARDIGFEHVPADPQNATDDAPEVADSVVDFLRSDPAADRPFYAQAGFREAHDQGWGNDEYEGPDPDEIESPPYLDDTRGIRETLSTMYEDVMLLDEGVGTILDALDDAGLRENTIVLFTTDHGIDFPRAKCMCYDPGVGIACLIRYPGHVDGGETYTELLSNVDMMPTLADLAGIDAPTDIDGRSFEPLLRGDDYEPRDYVLVESTYHEWYNPIRGIRTQDHKYLRNFWLLPEVHLDFCHMGQDALRDPTLEEYFMSFRDPEELYDLEADPHEQENLADDPAHEETLRALRSTLRDRLEADGDPLLDGPILPGQSEYHGFPEE